MKFISPLNIIEVKSTMNKASNAALEQRCQLYAHDILVFTEH